MFHTNMLLDWEIKVIVIKVIVIYVILICPFYAGASQ